MSIKKFLFIFLTISLSASSFASKRDIKIFSETPKIEKAAVIEKKKCSCKKSPNTTITPIKK